MCFIHVGSGLTELRALAAPVSAVGGDDTHGTAAEGLNDPDMAPVESAALRASGVCASAMAGRALRDAPWGRPHAAISDRG